MSRPEIDPGPPRWEASTLAQRYSNTLLIADPDPHHFGNLYTHPERNPHQVKIRIRIRIKVIRWIRIRINLLMTSQNTVY
jgi:hypothetical protein